MSIPSSFSVSASSGELGSFLSTDYDNSGLFSVLNNSGSGAAAATAKALGAGELTNSEHNVIQTIGENNGASVPIGWNANGTEPSLLTQMRNYGWIKLTSKSGSTSGGITGNYKLTTVGQAIYKRTGGGSVNGSDDLTNASLNSGAASTGLSASQSATLVSLLQSLGLDSSGTSSTSTSSTSGSTSSTGTAVNILT